jgi:hypothetical protein
MKTLWIIAAKGIINYCVLTAVKLLSKLINLCALIAEEL